MIVASVVAVLFIGCMVFLVLFARKRSKSYDLEALADSQYPQHDQSEGSQENQTRDLEAQQYTNVNSPRNGSFF